MTLLPELEAHRWLRAFLGKRGLSSPTGAPLYSYRCSASERADLARLLRLRPLDRDELVNRCAVFALFAAEQFRISRREGPWSWRTALDPLEVTGSTSLCAPLVEDGLSYWRRRVRTGPAGDQDFMFSIVLEGGFPGDLLTREEAHVGKWLTELQRRAELYRLSADEAALLAEETAGVIPLSLRRPESFHLAGELTAAVSALREVIGGLSGHVDPLRVLEEVEPEWRRRLPLEVEDEAARVLIRGLLSVKAGLQPVSEGLFERILVRTGDGWTAMLRIEQSCEFRTSRLTERAKDLLGPDVLRARLLADGALARTHNDDIGFIERRDDGWSFRSRSRGGSAIRFPLEEAVTMALTVGGQVSPGFVAPGGAPVLDEVVVFRKLTEDALVFFSNGGWSSRDDQIFVAFDPNETDVTLAPEASIAELGGLEGTTFRLHAITGRATLRSGTGLPTKIAAGQDRDGGRAVMMLPKPVQGIGPASASLGMPGLVYVHGLHVQHRLVRWRPVGSGGDWTPLQDRDPLGYVQIVVADEDGVVDRLRATVLPSTFRLERRAHSDRSGQITLRGLGPCRLHVVEQDGLQTNFRVDDDFIVIHVEARPTISEFAAVVVFPNGGRADLVLPVPRRGVAFVNAGGNQIERNVRKRIGDLSGVRVRGNDGELLVATLRDNERLGQTFARRLSDGQSLSAFNAEFRSMLAETSDLDAAIILDASSSRLELKRFDFELERSGEGFVRPAGDTPLDASETVSVEAFDIAGGMDIRTLWSGAFGEMPSEPFVSPDQSRPWMVWIAAFGQAVSRPALIPAKRPPETPDPFAAASYLGIRHRRSTAMAAHLEMIARQPGSPDWPRLRNILRLASGRLPLPAFDWLVALSQNERALAAFVAGAETEDLISQAFDIEDELAFIWETIPFAEWYRAFSEQLERLRALFAAAPEPELANDLMSDRLKAFAQARPSLTPVAFAIARLSGLDEAQLPPRPELLDTMRAFVTRNEGDAPKTLHALQHSIGTVPLVLRFGEPVQPCLMAPFIAAAACAGAQLSSEERSALRIARRFDPTYFNSAFTFALQDAMGQSDG